MSKMKLASMRAITAIDMSVASARLTNVPEMMAQCFVMQPRLSPREGGNLNTSSGTKVLHFPCAGGKLGSASQKAAPIKAQWQAEIRAYTTHVHLQDGVVDMSEDLRCDTIPRDI